MSPTRAELRYAGLSLADPAELALVAQRVLDNAADVAVLAGPAAATRLVRFTESAHGQPFHPGEVVVSEATVTVNGHRGDGLVLGLDPERALAAALCDGAGEAGLLVAEIDGLVSRTEQRRIAARRPAGPASAPPIDAEVFR